MKSDKAILFNTGYQIVGKIITAFFGVVMTFLMTRYLGARGFGEYNFVLAFIGLAYIIADFGLSPVLIRSYAEKSLHKADFHTLFTFRLLVLVVVLSTSTFIAKYILHYESFVVAGIAIGGIAHIFLMQTSTIWDLFRGSLAYHKIVISQILTSIVQVVLVWYVVQAALPPITFFSMLLVGYVAGFFATWKMSPFAISLTIEFTRLKKYLVMALPFVLGVAVGIASARVNILMLGNSYSPSMYPYVGYFSLAMRIFDVVILLGGYYGNTLFPYLSQKNGARMRREKFWRFFGISAVIAVGVTGGMLMFAKPIVQLLAGPTFEPAIVVTKILAWAAGIIIIEGLFFSYLLAMKKEKVWVRIMVAMLCLNIALNIMYIPAHSYIAVSWSLVATQGFGLLLSAGALGLYELKRRAV